MVSAKSKKSIQEILSNPTDYRVEEYTPERIAEFLLSNAVDAEDYQSALKEVSRLGLDPSKINHVNDHDLKCYNEG